jgi:hypothetical protein
MPNLVPVIITLVRKGDRLEISRIELPDGAPPGDAFLTLAAPTTAADVALLIAEGSNHKPKNAELAALAHVIDELRLFYRVAEKHREQSRDEAKHQRKIAKYLAGLRRELVGLALGAERREQNIIAAEAEEAIARLEMIFKGRGRKGPAALRLTWHSCAERLAAAYVLLINPTSGWSENGPGTRFVEAALRKIAPSTILNRAAIARVIERSHRNK